VGGHLYRRLTENGSMCQEHSFAATDESVIVNQAFQGRCMPRRRQRGHS
jgi:hypothetical protein